MVRWARLPRLRWYGLRQETLGNDSHVRVGPARAFPAHKAPLRIDDSIMMRPEPIDAAWICEADRAGRHDAKAFLIRRYGTSSVARLLNQRSADEYVGHRYAC
eukprot:scaffold393030_cov44-Prasinocladus_malaysianus.AAC.1